MKKVKGLFAVMLILCMITSTVSLPVMASENGADITSWKSSDYLDPDNPVTEGNPWSLESTNNASNSYEVFDGTEMKETEQALFPVMPDGNSPETAYIVNGAANWGNQGYNMAVNGKYMIPASIYSGTSGDDIKSASGKMAKVFTAPKDGTLIITAGETNGEGTEGNIATITLAADSWDAPRQNWNIIKDGEVLATANGASRVSAGSYDLVAIDNVTVDVAEGDKIYFEFVPSAWTLREKQACMWDPMVEYYNEGAEVDDTDYFVSSKYLDPANPYKNNPWTVESTNNYPDKVWQTVTNTKPKDAEAPLFPVMPDGEAPETAYVTTGDYSNGWGSNSVNTAVNGKYMIGGSRWNSGTDANVSATAKIAKVFTAPKDGLVSITALATMGEGSENLIVPAKTEADTDDDGLSWTVEKDGETLWTAKGNDRIKGDDYDKILFNDMTLEVAEGDKIYFVLNPQYGGARSAQACLWDPAIKYLELMEVDDTDSFTSSKYLDPEVRYQDNPWTVETNNNLDKVWESVTGITPALTNPQLDAFPSFPDGETPESGYFHSGKSWLVDGWNVDSYNAMVSGKYMVSPVTYLDNAWKVPQAAKIAKVFTAPKDGKLKITAAATMGEGSEGFIVNSVAEDWELDRTTWSVEKEDGTVLWSADGSTRTKESGYHLVEFEKMYVDVAAGDKIYFILSGRQYALRASHACMWDPVAEYTTEEDEEEEEGNIVDDTDSFLSSKYLDPENPYIDNPWSVESTNNASGTYEVFNGTTKKESEQALFPVMPDGNSPETAYIVSGEANWGSQGYNMAINGKYMIPASIYSGTSGDDIKTVSAKMAKVFTAPKAGKVKITAEATNGDATKGKIVTMSLAANSWDAPRQNWSIIKDGEVLATANGASRTSVGSYDLIEIDSVTAEVEEGDKIYFEFAPSAWTLREKQACMWEPLVKYVTGDEEEDEGEGEIVDDTTFFLSSKYLDPQKPYRNNPWTVESNNNLEKTWQTVTNTIPREAEFDLFPVMPDGEQPTTAYVQTGDINTNWGSNGVNIAVSGKYMVGGAQWYRGEGIEVTASCKIAKVFVAPKDGKIKITAAPTMGEGSEGRIVPVKVTDMASSGQGQSWMLEKNGTMLWSGNGTMRVIGVKYDHIEFPDREMRVEAGDKIRFIFQPLGWNKPRQEQACMWDPAIEYIADEGGDEGGEDTPEENDPNSFLSSYYLDPEDKKQNSPWRAESTNNNAGTWKEITNTTPHSGVTFPLFPTMPDGEQPLTGYIQTGEDCNNGWSVQGFEMAINGKYMIPSAFWTNDTQTAKAKIAKTFTASKAGMVRITAEATMGKGTEHLIIPNKVTEQWESNEDLAWILEHNGKQIWKRDGTQRDVGEKYDSVRFEPMIIELEEGDTLRFILQPKGYAQRNNMACMWDPRVTYIGDPIFLAEDSKDKSGIARPVDHTFELTLTDEPVQAINSESIVISGGKAKAENVTVEGKVLKFTVRDLEVNTSYDMDVKVVYAIVDDDPYTSNIKINFTTTDILSIENGIYAEGGLKAGTNTLKANVVCSDSAKIASGDDVVMIASVLNADGTVHSVKLSEVKLNARITPVECEVNVAAGQTVRVWIAASLDNIKPIGGKMTDIAQ